MDESGSYDPDLDPSSLGSSGAARSTVAARASSAAPRRSAEQILADMKAKREAARGGGGAAAASGARWHRLVDDEGRPAGRIKLQTEWSSAAAAAGKARGATDAALAAEISAAGGNRL